MSIFGSDGIQSLVLMEMDKVTCVRVQSQLRQLQEWKKYIYMPSGFKGKLRYMYRSVPQIRPPPPLQP